MDWDITFSREALFKYVVHNDVERKRQFHLIVINQRMKRWWLKSSLPWEVISASKHTTEWQPCSSTLAVCGDLHSSKSSILYSFFKKGLFLFVYVYICVCACVYVCVSCICGRSWGPVQMTGDLETVAGESESPDVVLETELEPLARAAKTQNLWVSHLPNSEKLNN